MNNLTLEQRKEKQRAYLTALLNRIPTSEQQLQSKCAELLYHFYPNDWKRLVCVHNNSFRANTQGFGIVPGASDMYWLNPGGEVLFIEFKFGLRGCQSESQKQWESLCCDLGHFYYLCYSEAAFWIIIGFNQPCEADIDKILERFM
jgi:hypothetical protein